MTNNPDLSEVRELPGGTFLEMQAGGNPALVLAQGTNKVRVELADVKVVVAAHVDAAADLAEVLAAGGVYNA